MANGTCCWYYICCPPPAADASQEEWDAWRAKVRGEVAKFLRKEAEKATLHVPDAGEVRMHDEYETMAAALLADNDLTPAGTGQLIVALIDDSADQAETIAALKALYAPTLRERDRQKGG